MSRTRIRSAVLCMMGIAVGSSIAFAQPRPPRIHTDRPSPRVLSLPDEDDTFTFAVFGDRTGGPASGIRVLEQAVADVNLLDPDLVMTVGDLVQGYNSTDEWIPQMEEFRDVMDRLHLPWFPVAGNHDIYWRGKGRPPQEHEGDYEKHFGPLWYAFEHKRCWFIVLYTDEANPETGERNFGKPECQRMSEDQFQWLGETLRQAKDARHIFVFMHHPRWLTNRYGDDWDRIHPLLAKNGNVSAVFAGHIHRMRYDGRRDGIEYFTLATVGGGLSGDLPGAGHLHQFHTVTVRDDGIQLAYLPVGTVRDPKTITGTMSDEIERLRRARVVDQLEPVALLGDGSVRSDCVLTLSNPTDRPIELTLTPLVGDRRWVFHPDHLHSIIPEGATANVSLQILRAPGATSDLMLPELEVQCDYLAEGARISIPASRVELGVAPPRLPLRYQMRSDVNHVLTLRGGGDALRVASDWIEIPDGPITLEAWIRGRDYKGRRGLLAKTEGSEFGIFVNDGTPEFSIHLDGRYASVKASAPMLKVGVWHHVAGQFDGEQVRVYVDGQLIASKKASGHRTRNHLPFYVGADVDSSGNPTSAFEGEIDEVRLSTVARYAATFIPPRRLEADSRTVLLLPMEQVIGPFVVDASGGDHHPVRVGRAELVEAAVELANVK